LAIGQTGIEIRIAPCHVMLFEKYHSDHVADRRVDVLTKHLVTLAPLGASILDVGCGDGRIASRMMNRRNDLSIVGVDVLKRESSVLDIQMFDGITIPFPVAAKDLVMFVDVLHHTEDPMVLLGEAVRVSRRWILIKDHFRDGLGANQTLKFMDRLGNARFGVALPYNYWSGEQWAAAFATLGLKKKREIRELGLYPWWGNWIFGRGLHFVALLEKTTNLTH
jgi:SAM-dependent methyltransferase